MIVKMVAGPTNIGTLSGVMAECARRVSQKTVRGPKLRFPELRTRNFELRVALFPPVSPVSLESGL
jgi:hypothetical protein